MNTHDNTTDTTTKSANDKLKVCPLCNKTFVCKPADCWCSNMPVKSPMLENGQCYCSGCMEAILDKKGGAPM